MLSRLRSLIYLLPQLGRTLLSRRSTVRFPFGPLELPSYFRGRVVVDEEKCKGCGACVRDCPGDGLELERESREAFRLVHYPDRCAYCGQCELSCRSGAIHQTNAFVSATHARKELVEVLVERKEDTEH